MKKQEVYDDIGPYVNMALSLRDLDHDRDRMFEGIDKMVHNDWSLPTEMSDLQWIRKVVSTDPYDALAAGTRVLSNLDPRIHFRPNLDNLETKARFAEWERVLKYWLLAAGKRRRATVVRDIVRSALQYDAVAAQVISVDYQLKLAKEGLGGSEKRWEIARQNGPFTVLVRNPRNVHVMYSDLMPEAVYCVTKHTPAEAVAYWGAKADAIRVEYPDDQFLYVHDVTTLENRCVWITNSESPGAGIVLMNRPLEIPFFPWVARAGGTNIDGDNEYQYMPILGSIYHSKQWETQNIVQTLFVSDIIARAAKPKGKKMGPNPDSIIKDYNEPGNDVLVPSGHDYQILPDEPLDQGMLMVQQNIQQAISKSTVAQILMGADVPSGTAFATLNLATQTAIGALKPYKELAELALGDVLALMCRWFVYNGKAMILYGKDAKADLGQEYLLDPDTIDVTDLDISVDLAPDVPSDRQQRINAAIMAADRLGYSMESALEDIGVTDPDREMKRRRQEKFEDAVFNNEIDKMRGLTQLKLQGLQAQQSAQIQMQQQQAAMQLQSYQQEQQMQAQYSQEQMNQMEQGAPTGATGMEQMFNPAMGGQPTAQIAPEATYEGQTGEARTGQEVVEE